MMHKFYPPIFLIFLSLSGFGQLNNQVCGTAKMTEIEKQQFLLNKAKVSDFNPNSAFSNASNCIPLKIHVVNMDDGTGGLSENDIAYGIANLNYSFLPADMSFYVCGPINYINNSDLFEFNGQAPDSDSDAQLAALGEVSNALNVYVVNSITTSGGFNAAGYAYFPANGIYSTRILMRTSAYLGAANGTFTHELGHTFSISHTHSGTESGNTNSNAENVPRSGANANCDTNGDTFCDTDADPRYSNADFDTPSCTYTGTDTDINGVVYTPPVTNLMSYYPDSCGDPEFTPDQYVGIAAGLVTRQSHTAYSLDCAPASIPAVTDLTGGVNNDNYRVEFTFTPHANSLGYILERSTTSASTGFRAVYETGAGPGIGTISDTNPTANTTYWYRVKAINGSCNTSSNVVPVDVGLLYCLSTYQSNNANTPGGCDLTSVYIDDFAVTDSAPAFTNDNTGCSTDGADFPTNFANFKATTSAINVLGDGTTTYNFTVGGPSIFYMGLFADLNQDGDFDDADENLYINPSSNVGDAAGTFIIPATATPGLTTLRVRVSNVIPITSACSYTAFGETEDYNLNILMPNLTPTASLSPVIISGSSSINFVMKVNEVGADAATNSEIIIRLPKDPKLTFTYDNALTTVGFDTVNNADWTYDGSDGAFHLFKSSVAIPASGSSSVGIVASYDPQGSSGVTSFTATIVPASGGDGLATNNVDVETLTYFP